MRNDERLDKTNGLCPPLPAFLFFFQSRALLNSQENLTIELTPEAQEGHGVECDNINGDSDCACE
ncbi:MAG TPA: hypothetical protein EYP49_13655 [Anaerolineae bacterium]|nr:hypothetical protein [Anaerolineae bacterium]